MSEYDEHPLYVTLEEDVVIPGPTHEPAAGSVFRARERSVGDDTTWFFGLNIGPEHAAVEIRNENIRSVAHLAPLSDGTENSDADSDTGNGSLTDVEFRALLDLAMVSDPWPLPGEHESVIETLLTKESQARDFDTWTHAYHEVSPGVEQYADSDTGEGTGE